MTSLRCTPLLLASCFFVLQGADLVLTWGLLSRPDMQEANPLALAVLAQQGWAGLILFKLVCTAVAIGAGLVVCRHRAATGARLLSTCCLIMTGVVGYSVTLMVQPRARAEGQEMRMQEQSSAIDYQLADMLQFSAARTSLCRDLLEGRILFPRAVEAMARLIDRHRPGHPAGTLRKLPPPGQPIYTAAYLLFHTRMLMRQVVVSPDRFERVQRAAAKDYPQALTVDFTAILCGQTPPWESDAPNPGPV